MYYKWAHPQKRRYYTAHIAQDLWGEWVVICSWGGFGTKRGGQKTVQCDSLVAAQARVASIAHRRRQRGYLPAIP